VKTGALLLSHTADAVNRAWSVNAQMVWPNAVNWGRSFRHSTVVESPYLPRTASILCAAWTGPPRPSQIDSAAALSDAGTHRGDQILTLRG
jgi:hypothetical protein